MSGGGACWRADDADGRQQLEFSRMLESSAEEEEEKGKNTAAGEAWRTNFHRQVYSQQAKHLNTNLYEIKGNSM